MSTSRHFPAPAVYLLLVLCLGARIQDPKFWKLTNSAIVLQPHGKFSLDVASFYNVYDHLTSFEAGLPFFEIDPAAGASGSSGSTTAICCAAKPTVWKQPSISTSLGAGNFVEVTLSCGCNCTPTQTSTDSVSESAEGDNPRHQFQLHSYLNLGRNLDLDTALYHVSSLSGQQVPAYTRIDARLGWHVQENIEVSGRSAEPARQTAPGIRWIRRLRCSESSQTQCLWKDDLPILEGQG